MGILAHNAYVNKLEKRYNSWYFFKTTTLTANLDNSDCINFTLNSIMSSDVDKHLNGIGFSHINTKGLLPTDRELSDLP